MTSPLVSVIVPTCNDAAFLPAALESLARQTMHDFEVVISDDGSTDRCREIAADFARRDSRFNAHVNPTNIGMTRNWNRALRETRGQYIAKLDADDVFRDETLARLVEAMESDNRPVVAYCRTLNCDEQLQPLTSHLGERALIRAYIDPLHAHCRPGHAWYRLSFDDIQIWHSNAQLHRRNVLLAMGGWDESWGCASDTDLILRVLERNEVVCHIPYAGVLYRLRPGSVSDQYRRRVWLLWESCLIHLESLGRYHRSGARLDAPLRKSWWRHWHNWTELRDPGGEALQELREDIRTRLTQRAARVTPPPPLVRVEGATRQWLWGLRHERKTRQP